MYLEPKSHLVFHGVLAGSRSVSFIKAVTSRPAVPIFCVQRRATPDGSRVKATSYLANCASQNQLYCIKKCGLQQLSCSHSISSVQGEWEIQARNPCAPGSDSCLLTQHLISTLQFAHKHCNNEQCLQGS